MINHMWNLKKVIKDKITENRLVVARYVGWKVGEMGEFFFLI